MCRFTVNVVEIEPLLRETKVSRNASCPSFSYVFFVLNCKVDLRVNRIESVVKTINNRFFHDSKTIVNESFPKPRWCCCLLDALFFYYINT